MLLEFGESQPKNKLKIDNYQVVGAHYVCESDGAVGHVMVPLKLATGML